MRRLTITPEIAARLIARPRVERQEQQYCADDALALAVEIGKQMCADFVLDADNTPAYTAIAKWLVNEPQPKVSPYKGIYLQGATGTGKTICLDIFRTVARYLQIEMNGEPMRWQSVSTAEVCDNYLETGSTEQYRAAQVVCFQDLGGEPTEVLYMGNRRNVMRQILEARGDHPDTLTLITSNIPAEKLGQYYGDRVASRIKQMCNILTMGGADRRK